MKKLLIILTLLFITSCGDFRDTVILESNELEEPYIVMDINLYNVGLSIYTLSTGTDYASYDDEITIVCPNGEFAIGDTLWFGVYKVKQFIP